ncbi:hypothetical protein O181_004359 [Austropuccinia psidii MF-1]|uniref:Uncharacterized protein n=1 Tax=Austropuccinia psidii MF-1 TaxID=1389203 RepID=A0A9Q3BG28_9BASI|nr:hypothetical protein [Austropuccinia psidii MF-1]
MKTFIFFSITEHDALPQYRNQGTYCWDAPSRPPISSDFGFSWDTALDRLQYGHKIPHYQHCEDPKKNRPTSDHDRMRPARTRPYHHSRLSLNGCTGHQPDDSHNPARDPQIGDWARVVWTDESAFELSKKVDWVQVWRMPQEKWNLENLVVNH